MQEETMTRRLQVFTVLVLIVAAAAFVRTQKADDALDPVRIAPDTHKVAFPRAKPSRAIVTRTA
jgi:hypothetical protein